MQHAFLCDHKIFKFHPTSLHLIFGRGIRQFALYVANICWSEFLKKENGRINAGSFLRRGGMMHFTAFKSPFTGVKDVPVRVTHEGDLEDGRLV